MSASSNHSYKMPIEEQKFILENYLDNYNNKYTNLKRQIKYYEDRKDTENPIYEKLLTLCENLEKKIMDLHFRILNLT